VIANLINGQLQTPTGRDALPIYNPANGEVIDEVPLSSASDVEAAVDSAARAFTSWSQTPLTDRVALMFRYMALLDAHLGELAAIITRHHGKTLDEARGEVRRGIDVVDFACGAPTLLQGRTLRDVSRGVDQDYYRYPLGIVAGITPFNFPAMIPLWMFPLAIVAGNTFVLKPSERTPLGAMCLAELALEAGFPEGVLNVVHGAQAAVDALIAHPDVRAVSFVGSEPVARHVYQSAARHLKRVQAAGGAKNHMFVMPDADLKVASAAILNSAFGNAGERCLAGSVAVAVGDAARPLLERLEGDARRLRVGPGDEPGVDIGPLIRDEHRRRVMAHVERGIEQGARVVVEGRSRDYLERPGFFLGPTILDGVTSAMAAAREEIFGPVLSVSYVNSLEEAVEQANRTSYGNMATLFTSSGRAARAFREGVEAGMVGINVGVAQPFAFYPFSGWRASFYGDLHLQGTDGVEFFTRKKVVVTRW
jgi:malonate-semialdehyde dehydrogenase (acetylating) / methylmalonate-semialdehyde dehydrogenase